MTPDTHRGHSPLNDKIQGQIDAHKTVVKVIIFLWIILFPPVALLDTTQSLSTDAASEEIYSHVFLPCNLIIAEDHDLLNLMSIDELVWAMGVYNQDYRKKIIKDVLLAIDGVEEKEQRQLIYNFALYTCVKNYPK